MCAELGSESLLSLEFELFLLVLPDLLQSGDGLLYLGAQLLSPLLEGGTIHWHFLEGYCGFCYPVMLVQKLLSGGCELFSVGVCCEVVS